MIYSIDLLTRNTQDEGPFAPQGVSDLCEDGDAAAADELCAVARCRELASVYRLRC